MKKIIMTALAFVSFNGFAGSPLTVGGDNFCDYSTIQEAIDSDLSNTIRVASNKVYFENITIDDKSMVLTGGYADCASAQSNIGDLSQAIIDGGDSGPVILVSGNSQQRSVDIRYFLIGNGDAGLMSTADVQLKVSDVSLINNNNVGSFLFGGDQNVSFDDVIVTTNGGSGVLCTGPNNVIRIAGESLITQNATSNNGGGMSISGGCTAHLDAPTKIENNTAIGHGGGIYVADGSLLNLNSIEVNNNQADENDDDSGNGGALYAEGKLSIVNAVNVNFEGNSAYNGGAIAVVEDARFTSYSANNANNPCLTPGQCSEYVANSAANIGGVLYAAAHGQILVLQAHFKNNGLFGNGLIAHASTGASVELEGTMVTNNGTDSFPATNLFFVNGISDNTTRITLDHVTVADNEISESVVSNLFGNFALNSSIIQESVDVSKAINAVSHNFECVMAHEIDSFSAGGTVTVNDPEFINPGVDYHIKPTSPAVDYCYDAASLTVELGYDIDFEGRNYDDPNVVDLHGMYDIGADEYRWDNDLIFMDGFE